MVYVTWPTYIILGPLYVYISGTGEARDIKFGVLIDRQACKPTKANVGQNGLGLRNVTCYYNFGTPLYLWNG